MAFLGLRFSKGLWGALECLVWLFSKEKQVTFSGHPEVSEHPLNAPGGNFRLHLEGAG